MRKLPWKDAIEFCNGLDFAGHNDWRLPTKEELFTIPADLLSSENSGQSFFLNVQLYYYWTLDSFPEDPSYAWSVARGLISRGKKTSLAYIWPVRGQSHNSTDYKEGQVRFINNEDGTITDNLTGLVWIKDLDSIFHKSDEVVQLTYDFECCPFCSGSQVYIDEMIIDGNNNHFCVCISCGCEGPMSVDITDAVYFWNKRSGDKNGSITLARS